MARASNAYVSNSEFAPAAPVLNIFKKTGFQAVGVSEIISNFGSKANHENTAYCMRMGRGKGLGGANSHSFGRATACHAEASQRRLVRASRARDVGFGQ